MPFKTVFISVSFVLLIIGCIYSAYKWIDMSISYSYLQESYEGEAKNAKVLAGLLERELGKIDEATLIQKLEAYKKPSGLDILLKKETDSESINFGTLTFVFENGKLKKIQL